MMKLKWIVVVIVVLLGITYATYANSYQGNYNVEVTVPMHAADNYHGSAWMTPSELTTECTPTAFWQFWSDLSFSDNPGARAYMVYGDLNGDTKSQGFDMVPVEDQTFTFDFNNVAPGSAVLRVYFVDMTTGWTVYDHTWDVVIG